MTPARSSSPAAEARGAIARLESLGSPRRAAEVQRYFKGTVASLGVGLPAVRSLVAEVFTRVRARWTVDDALRFADVLVRDPRLDVKSAGIGLAERFAPALEPRHLPRLERWLARHSGNWATVDQIAPHLVGPLLDRHAKLVPVVVGWTGSSVPWVRRAAAVAFVLHARRGRFLDEAYDVAARLLGDDDDLVRKATGWLLREAGKTDPRRLEIWLLRHGPRIPRTSLRYAIERFPDPARRRLLSATRDR